MRSWGEIYYHNKYEVKVFYVQLPLAIQYINQKCLYNCNIVYVYMLFHYNNSISSSELY
jgi:hypothetical protein